VAAQVCPDRSLGRHAASILRSLHGELIRAVLQAAAQLRNLKDLRKRPRV